VETKIRKILSLPNPGLVMSYHYNEAFENPDYHFSETLEIDRR